MPVNLGIGSVVAGAYRVVRKLGQGGMGAVWVVEHASTRKARAMKLMLPELATDPDFRERFTQEAQVGARIESEHVVEVVDAGFDEASGSPFLVMELLEGDDLAARLQRDSVMPMDEVVEILGQLAHALHAAHVAGIVHRDLKPENVFVAKARRVGVPYTVKVLDFGIAKIVKESRTAATITAAIGTPLWMPPEQTESGRRITPAADVWPFGLLAFRMLTGRYYWSEAYAPGSHVTAILTEVLIKPMVPASQRATGYGAGALLPAGFDAWFARCTDRDPANRYANAGEAWAALLRVLRPGVSIEKTAAWTMLAPRIGSGTELAVAPPPGANAIDGATSREGPPRGTTSPQLVSADGADAPRKKHGGPPKPLLVAGLGFAAVALAGAGWKLTKRPSATPIAAQTADAGADPVAAEDARNVWIRVEAPAKPWTMGVDRDDEPPTTRGFRPTRKLASAARAFELQQHEVTWGELEPFLATQPSHAFARPGGVPDGATKREKLPATGVPFATAQAYCKSIGGALPSEEQWELAARGEARRRFPWGDAQIDLARTRAFAGSGGAVVPVMSSEQDRTPGDRAIHDLLGNAQEWTADVFREDTDGVDETWADEGGTTYRAVRGVPLLFSYTDASLVAAASAAWREPVCANGPCAVGATAVAGAPGKLLLELTFFDAPFDKPRAESAVGAGAPDAGRSATTEDAGVDPRAVRKAVAATLLTPEARAELKKCVEASADAGLREGVLLSVRWSRPARNPKLCIDESGTVVDSDCCYGGGCSWLKYEKLEHDVTPVSSPTRLPEGSLPVACAQKAVAARLDAADATWPDVGDVFWAAVSIRWIGAHPSPFASQVGFRCARPVK